MKVVCAVRCLNEEKHIDRFLRGYDFCSEIIISDGGSTDRSLEIIREHQKRNPKIHLLNYEHKETVNGETWNEDSGHMNFVLDYAKSLEPRWIIFEDMDCVPNIHLRLNHKWVFEEKALVWRQINVFRLYLWGDTGNYFPYMNRNFDMDYTSMWAFRPDRLDIRADENVRHGTLVGLSSEPVKLDIPYCVLHRSWYPETIDAKVERYNKLGLPMNHPLDFAGKPEPLPSWAIE